MIIDHKTIINVYPSCLLKIHIQTTLRAIKLKLMNILCIKLHILHIAFIFLPENFFIQKIFNSCCLFLEIVIVPDSFALLIQGKKNRFLSTCLTKFLFILSISIDSFSGKKLKKNIITIQNTLFRQSHSIINYLN